MSVNHKKTSHKAKVDSQWIERLRQFAAGEMFHRGENPPKSSRWHRDVERIQACPAHRDASMACVCQYHQPCQPAVPHQLAAAHPPTVLLPPADASAGCHGGSPVGQMLN